MRMYRLPAESEIMEKQMTIETTRLMIHTASHEEMLRIIDNQKDDILRKAYQEMLQGCLDYPEHWVWYAVWIIECKDGSHVGDLSFKGFNDDGSVEIGYGIDEAHQGQGYARVQHGSNGTVDLFPFTNVDRDDGRRAVDLF